MTTNKTITIFNARYQASTRSEVYLPTVIQNVSFYESHASSATDGVWTDDSAYKFRIPFFGCEIQDDRPYMEADAFYRSKAEGWTIRKGDFVMLKAYAGDKTSGTSAKRRSFGLDNQKNSFVNDGYQMEIKDMAAAIEAEGGVDFMFFDACSMQTIEVAYALRNATEYIIASPAEIPGPGADYSTMVPAMFQKEDPVQQMLSAYYNAYLYNRLYGVVISAVKTEALEDFATEMRGIVQRYKSQLMDLDKQPLLNYFVYGTWGTVSPDCLDMQAVMQTVLPENEYGPWKEKLDAFVQKILKRLRNTLDIDLRE